MARRTQQKATVPFEDLPPVVKLSDESYGHLVRYRIVTEDLKKVSHWSPVYSVPIEEPDDVSGEVSLVGNTIQITWEDIALRPAYDIFVKFDDGPFEYHGTSRVHFYSLITNPDSVFFEVAVQLVSENKERSDFLTIYQTEEPVIIGFSALGGSFTVDANGYRHHIFNESGTLTVYAKEEKEMFVLLQDGGNNPTGETSTKNANGGSSGQTRYVTGLTDSSITVLVGGVASPSSVSAITTSTWQPSQSSLGGTGASFSTSTGNVTSASTNGSNGVLHSSKSSIYTSLSNIPTNTGGGGGGGPLNGPAAMENTTRPGGVSGGGTGGGGTNISGTNGLQNTGGGGGARGGSVFAVFNPSGQIYYVVSRNGTNGSGGSGYVVISYALEEE